MPTIAASRGPHHAPALPACAERRRIVARVHERIAWRRGDFAHANVL